MGVAWFLHPHVVLGPLSRAPGGFRQFDPFLVAADRILENRLLAVDLDFRHRRRLGFLVVWALVKKTHRVNPSFLVLCCSVGPLTWRARSVVHHASPRARATRERPYL